MASNKEEVGMLAEAITVSSLCRSWRDFMPFYWLCNRWPRIAWQNKVVLLINAWYTEPLLGTST